MLEYNGYVGSIEYSEDDEVLHGRLEFIRDLVTYETDDTRALKHAFHETVDDYIALCADEGHIPDTPLKSSFKIRPGRGLHRRAATFAKSRSIDLNTVSSPRHCETTWTGNEAFGRLVVRLTGSSS